jgi:hypothetical protein
MLAWFKPNLARSVQTDVLKAVHVVYPRFNAFQGWFCAFHEGMSLFSKIPSSPSIKGGFLLFI